MLQASLTLGNTLGAMLIGLMAAAILNGVAIAQAWNYYMHQSDSWPLKLLVGTVVSFDTIHQMLITNTLYTYTVTNWGRPANHQAVVWSHTVEVIFTGIITFLVQGFLAHRLWRLSNRNNILIGVIGFLILAEFASVMAWASLTVKKDILSQLSKSEDIYISVNALAVAGNILIAASLCFLLNRSRTGFQRSDSTINKLIFFSINTGLLTSVFAITSLITISVMAGTFIYIAMFYCISRLYTNTLLATLNTRKSIRTAMSGTHNTGSDNPSFSMRDFPKTLPTATRRPANISIKIDTATEFAADERLDYGGELVKPELGDP